LFDCNDMGDSSTTKIGNSDDKARKLGWDVATFLSFDCIGGFCIKKNDLQVVQLVRFSVKLFDLFVIAS
jgi:hypothetical protein